MKETFEKILESDEGNSYVNIQEKNESSRGNGECKEPMVCVCLECTRNDREASMAGTKKVKGREDEVKDIMTNTKFWDLRLSSIPLSSGFYHCFCVEVTASPIVYSMRIIYPFFSLWLLLRFSLCLWFSEFCYYVSEFGVLCIHSA